MCLYTHSNTHFFALCMKTRKTIIRSDTSSEVDEKIDEIIVGHQTYLEKIKKKKILSESNELVDICDKLIV